MYTVETKGEKVFSIFNTVFLILIAGITLYPFWYVFITSISNSDEVMQGATMLIPRGINFEAYKIVFNYPAIWNSYLNTIFYTLAGTIVSVLFTVLAAYPLSRKKFVFKKFFLVFITFTMFFYGGLIPTYYVVQQLHMIDTQWAIIIPGAIGTWYVIILRSFFLSLPDSFEESAKIDGASDLRILFMIILPLSKAAIAIITLYYAVGQWNSFFSALMYLNDNKLYPLQLILNQIVIQNDTARMQATREIREGFNTGIRFAAIILAVVPILAVYPFIQKYFVKGVLIGSLKG